MNFLTMCLNLSLEIIGFCVASFGAGDSVAFRVGEVSFEAGDSVVLELVEVSLIRDDSVTLAPLSHGG